MRIKLLYLLLMLFFLSFCRQPEETSGQVGILPDSVISPSELADYMVEIFLIEAAVFKAQHDGKNVHDYAKYYYDNFFSRHKLSKDRLNRSVEYYVAKKQIESILQNVVAQLTELDLKTPATTVKDTVLKTEKDKSWIEKMLNGNNPEN